MMDPKQMASMVVGIDKMPKPPMAEDVEGMDSDDDYGAIAGEILTAVKSGDVGAFNAALKSYVDMCMNADT